MPKYQYKGGLPRPSIKSFQERIDSAFDFYLRGAEKAQQEHVAEAAELMRKIFTTQLSLSEVLQEQIGSDIDWNSDRELEPSELEQHIQALIKYHVKEYSLREDEFRNEARKKEKSPLAVFGAELFGIEQLSQIHMNLITGFLHRQQQIYLQKVRTEKEKASIARMNFQGDLNMMYEILALSKAPDTVKSELFHALINLLQDNNASAVVYEEVSDIIKFQLERLEDESQDEQELIDAITANLAIQLKGKLPESWPRKDEEPRGEIIVLNEAAFVKPVDNFFFTFGNEESPAPTDSFPTPGILVYSGSPDRLLFEQDVSIFDKDGKKVFWGDLKQGQIDHLIGTYYILSQNDSCHKIPAWAVKAETMKAAPDPHRPANPLIAPPRNKVAIDINYMRIAALYRIKDGKLEKNAHTIPMREKSEHTSPAS